MVLSFSSSYDSFAIVSLLSSVFLFFLEEAKLCTNQRKSAKTASLALFVPFSLSLPCPYERRRRKSIIKSHANLAFQACLGFEVFQDIWHPNKEDTLGPAKTYKMGLS